MSYNIQLFIAFCLVLLLIWCFCQTKFFKRLFKSESQPKPIKFIDRLDGDDGRRLVVECVENAEKGIKEFIFTDKDGKMYKITQENSITIIN